MKNLTIKRIITIIISAMLIVGVVSLGIITSGFTNWRVFDATATSAENDGVMPYNGGTTTINIVSSGILTLYRSNNNNVSATSGNYTINAGSYGYSYSVISDGSSKQVTVNYKLNIRSIIADYWYRVSLPSLGCTIDNSAILVTYNKNNTASYPPKEFTATMSGSYVYIASDADDSGSDNNNTVSVTVISIQP